MPEIRIGVVGYSPPTIFDEKKASKMIKEAYGQIEKIYPDYQKTVVSGLTNVGVPKIAYEEAKKRDWRTVGVACSKAHDFEIFPVDQEIIIGDEWGDESMRFLSEIDMIIRIGGGKQSYQETEEIKKEGKLAIEYDLPALN